MELSLDLIGFYQRKMLKNGLKERWLIHRKYCLCIVIRHPRCTLVCRRKLKMSPLWCIFHFLFGLLIVLFLKYKEERLRRVFKRRKKLTSGLFLSQSCKSFNDRSLFSVAISEWYLEIGSLNSNSSSSIYPHLDYSQMCILNCFL